VPAGQFKKVKAEQLLRSYLNAQYGPKDWISYFDNKSVYFNHFVVEDARVDLREMQQKSSDFLLKLTGVANVLSPSATENVHHNEGVMRLMSNSYNQKRSGDLLINLEPGWIDQTMTEATAHGSPYNYDTHVPLIWYGWTIDKASITRHISLADIAPTISMFLRVPEPNTCNGNPIWELSKEY
jgi:phytoene dehydrogenase-like protein